MLTLLHILLDALPLKNCVSRYIFVYMTVKYLFYNLPQEHKKYLYFSIYYINNSGHFRLYYDLGPPPKTKASESFFFIFYFLLYLFPWKIMAFVF